MWYAYHTDVAIISKRLSLVASQRCRVRGDDNVLFRISNSTDIHYVKGFARLACIRSQTMYVLPHSEAKIVCVTSRCQFPDRLIFFPLHLACLLNHAAYCLCTSRLCNVGDLRSQALF